MIRRKIIVSCWAAAAPHLPTPTDALPNVLWALANMERGKAEMNPVVLD